MAERVFVTGGSGFVGKAVIQTLISRGFAVNALVNRKPLETAANLKSFSGSLFDLASLDAAMAGCSSVVQLVGIIREDPAKNVTFERIHHQATRNVAAAASRAGITRHIQMSAIGASPTARSEYHRTKFAGEEAVRSHPLRWTIIRPSLIHGPGGAFTQMEANWARGTAMPFLFMPYFGRGIFGTQGAGRLQPVFVEDVARAFVDALGNEKTIGKVYEIGGPQKYSWPELHRTFARAIVGKTRPTIPIPAWYARLLTRVVPAKLLPFNRDQVVMSDEDNTCDLQPFTRDFGWVPRSLSETLANYVKQI